MYPEYKTEGCVVGGRLQHVASQRRSTPGEMRLPRIDKGVSPCVKERTMHPSLSTFSEENTKEIHVPKLKLCTEESWSRMGPVLVHKDPRLKDQSKSSSCPSLAH